MATPAIGTAALTSGSGLQESELGIEHHVAPVRRVRQPMEGTDMIAETTTTGQVILVGGGPGDPDLLTVGGLRALQAADVVLYDHLAPLACLTETKPAAILLDVGKIPRGCQTAQADINTLLIEHASSGATVVRFKGGDPFVLGRGSEEWLACAGAGIPVRVIPGVSSAIAGPELAGIPLTHRGITQNFSVVSGHVGPDHPASTVNWDALARSSGTIVILMGVAHLADICTGLIDRGLDPDTPAAIVAKAASLDQKVLRGTVVTLPDLASAAEVEPPALIVIGEVVALNLNPEPEVQQPRLATLATANA